MKPGFSIPFASMAWLLAFVLDATGQVDQVTQLEPALQIDKHPVPLTPALDCLGDPLPPGALARLGSIRFQIGTSPYLIAASPDGTKIVTVSRRARKLVDDFTVWDAT